MTEEQWLACRDPQVMVDFLVLLVMQNADGASDRKQRLFAAACCRLLPPSLLDEPSRAAIDEAERYADGQATEEAMCDAAAAAWDVVEKADRDTGSRYAAQAAYQAVGMYDDWSEVWDAWRSVALALAEPNRGTAPLEPADESWESWLCVHYLNGQQLGPSRQNADARTGATRVLRDLFGLLPFRPVRLDPALLTYRDGRLVHLAQAAYDHRQLPEGTLDPARLAVLADALEEAGCDSDEILSHLRRHDVPHVRGCWPVDLLIGKL